MPLMDEIMSDNEIKLIGCCNELNAGYAADGYARNSGQLGVVVGKANFTLPLLTMILEFSRFNSDLHGWRALCYQCYCWWIF